MEELGAFEKDVVFDFAAAERLRAALVALAERVGASRQVRSEGLKTASKDWHGDAATRYPARVVQGMKDVTRLGPAIGLAAQQVARLAQAAREENARRAAARAWVARKEQWERDHPKQWWDPRDWDDYLSAPNWEEKIGPMPSGPITPPVIIPTAPATSRS
ncbi:MAG TPA: hypothetical protein VIL36_07340 [Acidimicrobiales bacterium]